LGLIKVNNLNAKNHPHNTLNRIHENSNINLYLLKKSKDVYIKFDVTTRLPEDYKKYYAMLIFDKKGKKIVSFEE